MAQSLTEQFKAFVASKPADERYEYWSFGDCPVAQFGRHAGLLDEDALYNASEPTSRLHAKVAISVYNDGIDHTFGALHQRLEAL